MLLNIRAQVLKKLMDALGAPFHSHIEYKYGAMAPDTLKSNDVIEVEIRPSMSNRTLARIREELNDTDETTAKRILTQLLNSINDEEKPLTSFTALHRALELILSKNPNKLLFDVSQNAARGIAYLPLSIRIVPKDRWTEEHVELVVGYLYNGEFHSQSYNYYKHRLGTTVGELLKSDNLVIPTDEMMADYEKLMTSYRNLLTKDCVQLWTRGTGFKEGQRWWRNDSFDMAPAGRKSKAVLNSPTLAKRRVLAPQRSEVLGESLALPEHPVLPVFSLLHHEDVLVSVADVRVYKYEEDIAERLVLPESHSRLIGALVSNLEALAIEDDSDDRSSILGNKARCSLLIARGPAGTGKTLTAEVYAEQIKRPLYEVHSGQLGTEGDIEENLQDVLNRSIMLKMPLVINEADVFIKARGDDVRQNAVCAVFLRLLEYHTGLVWLTTNRDDIDDAIRSRALAEILYKTPKEKERARLWRIQLKQFNVELSKEDIAAAVSLFPEVTGRDIQNLIRLTMRVCLALNEEFSLTSLKNNAVFKGITVKEDAK